MPIYEAQVEDDRRAAAGDIPALEGLETQGEQGTEEQRYDKYFGQPGLYLQPSLAKPAPTTMALSMGDIAADGRPVAGQIQPGDSRSVCVCSTRSPPPPLLSRPLVAFPPMLLSSLRHMNVAVVRPTDTCR